MAVDQKGKLQLESETHIELDPTSLDDCQRSVLNIIAERAPCPEPKLFIAAINSGLECFGGRSLADLRELLGQCIQDLKAGGLVEIVENEFVLANTGSAGTEEEDTLDQSTELELDQAAELKQGPFTLEGELTDQDRAEEPKPEAQQAQDPATDEVGDTHEPAKDDASLPQSAEDGDIFDLTGELELAPEELEEASIDQDHAEVPASDTPETCGVATDDAEDGQDPITEGIDARNQDERDMDASSPESAEDADVFDLTDALELVPEEQEDTAIDQDRVEEEPQAGSAASDDSQDAAEPGREEIIAAMRQFVSAGKPENSE